MSDANDTDDVQDSADVRELLIHPYAWAVDDNAGAALRRLARHWNGSFQETEELQRTRFRGELHKHTPFGHVEADEILESELLEIDGDDLATLKHHVDEAEIMADRLLEEADEVEQEVED